MVSEIGESVDVTIRPYLPSRRYNYIPRNIITPLIQADSFSPPLNYYFSIFFLPPTFTTFPANLPKLTPLTLAGSCTIVLLPR